MLAQSREADEVGEQDRHQPPLGEGAGGTDARLGGAASVNDTPHSRQTSRPARSRRRTTGTSAGSTHRSRICRTCRQASNSPQDPHRISPVALNASSSCWDRGPERVRALQPRRRSEALEDR